MDVGVRELKARLSHYLDRVAGGETIRVTDRGKPKALLAPIGSHRERPPEIQRGIEEGWITPARSDDLPAFPKRRFKGRMTVEELIAEDRGE